MMTYRPTRKTPQANAYERKLNRYTTERGPVACNKTNKARARRVMNAAAVEVSSPAKVDLGRAVQASSVCAV